LISPSENSGYADGLLDPAGASENSQALYIDVGAEPTATTNLRIHSATAFIIEA